MRIVVLDFDARFDPEKALTKIFFDGNYQKKKFLQAFLLFGNFFVAALTKNRNRPKE